jgi:hypothetical protein
MKQTCFIVFFVLCCLIGNAQKFHPTFETEYESIGIIAGYHFKDGLNFTEIGLSFSSNINGGHLPLFWSYSLSIETGKSSDQQNIYGIINSAWINAGFVSLGASLNYYADVSNSNKNAFSLRPTIGLGILSVYKQSMDMMYKL